MEEEIADKARGESDMTDEEIAEYWAWKSEVEKEQAGLDSRLLVRFVFLTAFVPG